MSTHWKNNVLKRFDQQSQYYGSDCDIQQEIAQNLAHDLPIQNINKVLEIGCGTGNLTKHLVVKYPQASLHITDISPSMIEQARKNVTHNGITWGVMDAENLTATEQYDLIVASMALQWCEDLNQAINTLTQCLTQNGALYITSPDENSFPEWQETLQQLHYPSGILDFQAPSGIYKRDIMTKSYGTTYNFLKSMKTIGASNPKKSYTPLSPTQIKHACQTCDANHHGNISWEIIYARITRS